MNNITEAEALLKKKIIERGGEIDVPKCRSRVKPGNSVVYTKSGEVYHLKFTNSPWRPDDKKEGGARELDSKYKFAIKTFSYRCNLREQEQGTLVGIDEDLVLSLLSAVAEGYSGYIVTGLQRDILLWIAAMDFYNFVLRHDTFMKFPKSGCPVLFVPTGYFLQWGDPVVGLPMLTTEIAVRG